jgi:phosphoglycolate phosphatase-like HAD superfamily hydrolase
MTLLLFDIDGTLLHVTGGVDRAVAHAVSTVTGQPLSTEGVTFSGRTDPEIFRDVLRASGVADPDPVLDDVIAAYVEAAQQTIRPADVEVLPGIRALLSALSDRSDVFLGLLTGNVEPIAYHKLRGAGLSEVFPVGAFGSDDADRAALPPVAVRRASAQAGRSFAVPDTVIIGDTHHDIRCARAAGSRSVAVCTGRYGRADLEPHAPDLLLEDLRAPHAAIREILGS